MRSRPPCWTLGAAVAASNILSEMVIAGTEHVVSTTAVHDIHHDISIPLWEFNMPSSDAFALRRSGLNEFLFAPVGTEANGMTLSLVSGFARLGRSMAGGGQAGRVAKDGSDRESGANHREHANQRLATTSRDDDCYPIDCTAADAAGREPGTASASISLWREGRPNFFGSPCWRPSRSQWPFRPVSSRRHSTHQSLTGTALPALP